VQHPILTAALEYAQLGYRVIPLKPGSKVPDLRHWPEEASNDPTTVIRHFDAAAIRAGARGDNAPGPYPNVGIVTGNGLAVLDLDVHHGASRPLWAVDTLTVRTASGGLHLYYAVDRAVPNSVGRLGLGIDVRGERGQVAAPPSRISGSGEYSFEVDRPIARLDAELLIPEDCRQDFAGRSARKFEYRDEVPIGQRNNYLTSLAGYLFAQGDEFRDVLDAVKLEAQNLGFTPRKGEIEGIVHSVARYHIDQPAI